ncbi:hypothetical protein GDO86_010975 [Hymenochirus boettgeri]|uniref:Uncharacterized protein n=1 Tax=Hymenochirus boettgeri TaxID=247094 RepID=A0A8T2JHR8_9PIPI|nr:hypothetical protein GDO86_010975 [Hymenochirus boettgeri]
MTEKKRTEKKEFIHWTDKEKEEFITKFREQTVVVDELSNLRKDRKVYRQQPNSHLFFLTERAQTFSECKKTLDDMKYTYQELEKSVETQIKK